MRRCYAFGCHATVSRTYAFCRECDLDIPTALRKRIWRTREAIEDHAAGLNQRPLGQLAQEFVAAIRAAREELAARRWNQ